MQPHVRALFTDETKAEVARVVGVRPEDLIEHGAFESVVHRVEQAEGSFFVKSTWHERRTREQIDAEMRFVQMLADAGVRVARPVPLRDGGLVATVPVENGAFQVSATRRAPGTSVYRTDITEGHFFAWGRLLAQMHAVAREPEARVLIPLRPSWEEEHDALREHADDPRIVVRYEELLDALGKLPTDPEVFGLMHTDVHASNVHWEGTTPTAFDFDDCIGFWYASDLAIVLFYTLDSTGPEEQRRSAFARNYEALRRGYEALGALPAAAWDTLPLFLNLREAVLYLVVQRSIPPEARHERLAAVTQARRERLIRGESAMGLLL